MVQGWQRVPCVTVLVIVTLLSKYLVVQGWPCGTGLKKLPSGLWLEQGTWWFRHGKMWAVVQGWQIYLVVQPHLNRYSVVHGWQNVSYDPGSGLHKLIISIIQDNGKSHFSRKLFPSKQYIWQNKFPSKKKFTLTDKTFRARNKLLWDQNLCQQN